MKRGTRIALLVVLAACSRALGGEAVVSVVKAREPATLSQPQQTLLAEGIRRLMETCWLNSLDHPPIAPEGGEKALWSSIESQSHVYARFEEPLEIPSMSGPPRLASEVLIGLEGSSLLGPELARHGQTIGYYTKCDGRLSVELLCAAPLAQFLSAEQKENCERLAPWLQDAGGLGADDLALAAIVAGKKILASSIDPSQPQEPVETWLRRLLPEDAAVRWEANDCGEGGDAPDRLDGPICAELRGEWAPGFVVSLLFAVGTERKGISGNPTFFWAYIQEGATLQELTSLRDARERIRGLSRP